MGIDFNAHRWERIKADAQRWWAGVMAAFLGAELHPDGRTVWFKPPRAASACRYPLPLRPGQPLPEAHQ